MPTEVTITEWPSVRDVADELGISNVYAHKLVHTGKLRYVQTRLGKLIDPQSLRVFAAERAQTPPRLGRPPSR